MGIFCLSVLFSLGILAEAQLDFDDAPRTQLRPAVAEPPTNITDDTPSSNNKQPITNTAIGMTDAENDVSSFFGMNSSSSSHRLIVCYKSSMTWACLLCVVWIVLFAGAACHHRLNHATRSLCFRLLDFDGLSSCLYGYSSVSTFGFQGSRSTRYSILMVDTSTSARVHEVYYLQAISTIVARRMASQVKFDLGEMR